MLIGMMRIFLYLGLTLMIFHSSYCVERRQTKKLSQTQIRNKFIVQWNKLQSLWDRLDAAEDIAGTAQKLSDQVDALESDILTLQSHEDDVAESFEQKCKHLDTLLDPDYDCCLSDDKFQLYCVQRVLTNLQGWDTSVGVCNACSS